MSSRENRTQKFCREQSLCTSCVYRESAPILGYQSVAQSHGHCAPNPRLSITREQTLHGGFTAPCPGGVAADSQGAESHHQANASTQRLMRDKCWSRPAWPVVPRLQARESRNNKATAVLDSRPMKRLMRPTPRKQLPVLDTRSTGRPPWRGRGAQAGRPHHRERGRPPARTHPKPRPSTVQLRPHLRARATQLACRRPERPTARWRTARFGRHRSSSSSIRSRGRDSSARSHHHDVAGWHRRLNGRSTTFR